MATDLAPTERQRRVTGKPVIEHKTVLCRRLGQLSGAQDICTKGFLMFLHLQ